MKFLQKTKRTALHNACLSGNAKVVRALLRAKADPNVLDEKQSTPAHEAAKGGHFEVRSSFCIQTDFQANGLFSTILIESSVNTIFRRSIVS